MPPSDDASRVRGLLDLARIVRGDEPLPRKLERIAAAAASSLGFGAVAISLRRPAWDDHELAASYGGPVPDALELPLLAVDGSALGALAVDRPVRRGELELLETFAAHTAQAIESAQDADAAARRQHALEQLLLVSASLREGDSAEAVLQRICEAARDALGFELAVIELADREADRYRPAAVVGIDPSHPDVRIECPTAGLDGIFDPAFEREGCYLLERGEALARIAGVATTYASSRNGRGPHAWNRHWLVAPWRDADGAVAGFIWVDDPSDHLIPPRPRLQALRLLANQAAAALESAARFETLRATEELQRTMLAASPAGIISVGADCRIRSWNDAARRMFGFPDELVLGHEPPWIEEADRADYRRRFRAMLESGAPLHEAVFHDRRADGTIVDVRTSSAVVRDAAGAPEGVVAVIEDIGDRLRAATDLERRNSELEALHATTLNLLDRLDVGSALETIVAQAGSLLGVDNGYLYLVDRERGELTVAIGRGVFAGHDGERLRRGEGIGGRVWATGEPLAVEDYDTWDKRDRRYEALGFHAVAGVPLRSGSEVVGVLGVAYDEPGRSFAGPELALLERFARLASLTLTNARLYEDLRASQELYRTVVESSRDMILLLGLDGRIAYASPSQRALLGYDEEELVGRSSLELVHPDDVEPVRHVVAAVLAGTPAPPQAARALHRDGRWVDVEGQAAAILGDDGRPVGVLGVVRDITERRRAEEARREAQASLVREKEHTERLIQSANAMIVGVDRAGRLEVFNAEAERITGYSRDELAGRDWLELLVPADRFPGAPDLFASSDALADAFEHPIVTRRGDERIVSWRTRAIVSPEGEREGWIAFGIDQTERHDLEEQLRQAQKMEAIGQLAGGIAHDFNNLLTAITGYGDLALARLDADHPVRRNIEEMLRAGDRAAVLTRQLLAYSRKQVLQPKVVSLNDVVNGIDSMLSRLLGERVELSTRLDPALGRTRADPGQLEQVLMNLAINARDAMPDGGRLAITTANVELDERFARQHVEAPAGEYVVLAVGDTGVGMDRDTLERVFDPFFTTKPPGQGTGLGLSTVYGIVKQTGGQVLVSSEPGRGTTFKVYLPRVWERSAQREAGRAVVSARAGGGSETVLLVEDEEVVRTLVREMLEADGYDVLAAAGGADALELAGAHPRPIDVLVTDVVMPGLSGQRLASRLLEEQPGALVVFTSGYTEDAIASHGVLRAGTAFLEKPFSGPELARTLRALLDAERAA